MARRRQTAPAIDADNARKVQQALNVACGVTANMSCYVRDGWAWNPEEVVADLERIIAIVKTTAKDGKSPW